MEKLKADTVDRNAGTSNTANGQLRIVGTSNTMLTQLRNVDTIGTAKKLWNTRILHKHKP